MNTDASRNKARQPTVNPWTTLRSVTLLILVLVSMALSPVRAQDAPLPAPGQAGRVVELAQDPPTGLWLAWLDNGVRVLHRASPVDDGRVHVSLLIAGGELLETQDDRGIATAARLAWDGLSVEGAGQGDLQSWVAGHDLRLTTTVGPDSMALRIDAPAGSLADAVALAYALVRAPEVPAEQFDEWQRKERARLAGGDGVSPAFAALLASTLFPKDEPRLHPIERGDVEKLTAAKATAWLRRQAVNPMALAIIGGPGPDRALDLAAGYFGSLPERSRIGARTFADARKLPPFRGPAFAEHADPRVDGAIVLRGFIGADLTALPDARRLRLAAMVLRTRLAALAPRLRAREADLDAGSFEGAEYPGYGLFWIRAQVPARGVDRALDAFDAELTKLGAQGPTKTELEAARARVFSEIETLFGDPSFWADRLAHMDYRGMSPKDLAALQSSYAMITAEQVRDAVARHNTEPRRITVVLKGSEPAKGD